MLDVLKRLLTSLQPKTASSLSTLADEVRAVLGRVHLHIRLSHDQVVRGFDDELTSSLSSLSVDLESMASERPAPAKQTRFMTAAQPVIEHIDRILSSDVRFRDLKAFELDLRQLLRSIRDLDSRLMRRKRWLTRLALLVSVGPVLGYTVHWAIGTYYSAALLEQVDIAYPEISFELTGQDYYRARYEDTELFLKPFEEHYFAQTLGPINGEVPLPSVYDDAVAEQWGVPRPDEPSNLFIHRVFLRSIKDANVLNKLGVSIRRVDDSEFFWRRFDLSTELELSAQGRGVRIRTTRRPIKDVSVSFEPVVILGQRVTPVAEGSDHIVSQQTYSPTFGEHEMVTPDQFPIYFRFSSEAIPPGLPGSARDIRVARPENDRELDREIWRIWDFINENPLVSIPCVDDSVMAIATDTDSVRRTAATSLFDELMARVDYSLLDDTRRSQTQSLSFSEPFVFVDETNRTDAAALADCIAPGLEAPDMERAQAGILAPDFGRPGGVVAALDSAARFLADDLKVAGGEIVLEESFYFDLENTPAPAKSFRRNVKILKDGDFVVINVALTSYPSGIYELDFLFNDDVVASIRVDPLWPQSLKYKPEDDPLFSERDDS